MANLIAAPEKQTLTKKELAGSKLYPNINTPEKAAVVLAKARSYSLCPTVIADGLYFVGGKPALSAQLIATLLKRSGKYDYRIKTKTDKECSLEFFEIVGSKRESLGVETFTMAMATRAGLMKGKNVNWSHYPEAMLWARCLTAGVRARCPDALGGNPVYSVEELSPSTEVDAEGRPVVEGEVIDGVNLQVLPPAGSNPILVELDVLLDKTDTDVAKLCSHYQVSSLRELTDEQMQDALSKLGKKLEILKDA